MCGICGIFGKHERRVIKPMTESLKHRGPDDFGFFYHRDLLTLGQRRLSIIDLSTGRQPIYNEDKSVAVVFNGEIYNYKELRPPLEKKGHKFYTNTDTEVIVHLYEEYGEEFVQQLNGDFAIALFDSRIETLYLVRDRFGIRSIYYHSSDSAFIFGSEIKAVLASGMVEKTLNLEALNYYLTLRYVPDEHCLFAGISKIRPGTMLKLTSEGVEEKPYYSLKYSEDNTTSEQELTEEFESLLLDSVKLRMRSDVPVGAFLSGGIDSSVIVGMARTFTEQLNTFSVGFRTAMDENKDARRVSAYLGSTHHDIYVKEDDYTEIAGIVKRMDEPIGDFILLPTYFLNKCASEKVKVVLTGEGADEILGGYLHHLILNRIWDYRKVFSKSLTAGLRLGVRGIPPKLLNLFFPYPAFLGKTGKERLLGLLKNLDRILPSYLSFAGLFSAADRREMLNPWYYRDTSFEHLLSHCPLEAAQRFRLNTVIDIDMNAWLPDYTLLKQDRLTMMNSIEGRVPFLDHRLVEFCARLPDKMKNNFMRTKYILRQASKKYVPREVTTRKKQAFYIPTEEVFDSGYRSFIHSYLFDQGLIDAGIFNREYLETLMKNYGSREIIVNKRLNTILIFSIWFKEVFSA